MDAQGNDAHCGAIRALRLADEGVRVGDVCRQMGIAEKTFPPDGYVPEMPDSSFSPSVRRPLVMAA